MNPSILLSALKLGRSLPHAARWKWSGAVTLLLLALLQVGRVLGWVPPEVTDESAVEFVGVVYALYTQLATSEKVGL